MNCPICERRCARYWVIVTQKGERVGPYCTKACAEADAWGPNFRNATIVRVP